MSEFALQNRSSFCQESQSSPPFQRNTGLPPCVQASPAQETLSKQLFSLQQTALVRKCCETQRKMFDVLRLTITTQAFTHFLI